jgi:hypothetical protein
MVPFCAGSKARPIAPTTKMGISSWEMVTRGKGAAEGDHKGIEKGMLSWFEEERSRGTFLLPAELGSNHWFTVLLLFGPTRSYLDSDLEGGPEYGEGLLVASPDRHGSPPLSEMGRRAPWSGFVRRGGRHATIPYYSRCLRRADRDPGETGYPQDPVCERRPAGSTHRVRGIIRDAEARSTIACAFRVDALR